MDKLDFLETLILKWHLKKGLKLFEDQKESDKEWTFKTFIESEYKRKILRVISFIDGKSEQIFFVDTDNIEDMYAQAVSFFN